MKSVNTVINPKHCEKFKSISESFCFNQVNEPIQMNRFIKMNQTSLVGFAGVVFLEKTLSFENAALLQNVSMFVVLLFVISYSPLVFAQNWYSSQNKL